MQRINRTTSVMEEEKQQAEDMTQPQTRFLLKSYRWHSNARTEQKGAEKGLHSTTQGNSSSKWGKFQSWKRAHSHPETTARDDAKSAKIDPGDAAASQPPESRVALKRSLFQRAFSAPAKGQREPGGSQETCGGGSKTKLRKYFQSMSDKLAKKNTTKQVQESAASEEDISSPVPRMPLTPSPEVPVWDVSSFTLMDGQLMLVTHDEEQSFRNRNRTGSCVSDSVLYPLCNRTNPDPSSDPKNQTTGRAPASNDELDSTSQFNNVKGLIRKRIKKITSSQRTDHTALASPNHHRVQGTHGSHESLVTVVELLDLNAEKDVTIRPLHSSILGEKYCFEIINSEGSRCFGCSSIAERDRWIENLRQTVQPNKDNCERVENILSLWIYEAKDLPPSSRRRYFCELHLDGSLYARTTSKQLNSSGLFWGEHFEFDNLPQVSEVTVHLLREDDKKNKDPTPLGGITIPLADLSSRLHVEKWYPITSTGTVKEKPAAVTATSIRVKGRHQRIKVLPIVQYKEFAEYLTFHYKELCRWLEPALTVKDKEELAYWLVRVLQSTGKAKAFLIDLGIAEVDRFDEKESLIFRENTLATKAIDEYMKLVGQKYLLDTLGDFIAQLYESEDCCEVDTSKCQLNDLSDNQNNLRQSCEEAFKKITESYYNFPAELNEIFAAWQKECQDREKEGIGQRLICASLFLRFLCPAIMSPSLFHLTQEYPGDGTSRTLTLVAKVIQNMANFTTFGDKEEYMGFMNDVLEQNQETMTEFLQNISSTDSDAAMVHYEGYIDLGSSLSILHSILCRIVTNLDQQTKSKLEPLPTILTAIQEGSPVPASICIGPKGDHGCVELEKPGFLAPRDLNKHSPLVNKSQSMISIQKQKEREEDRCLRSLLRSHSLARDRKHVQRTQSVPSQGKAHRVRKHRSSEHLPESLEERDECLNRRHSTQRTAGDRSAQMRGRLRTSASLPRRKSTVPWEFQSEENARVFLGMDQNQSSEQYQKEIGALRAALDETREKHRSLEAQLGMLADQIQELVEQQALLQKSEEQLRCRLEAKEKLLAQTGSRLTAMEEELKKAKGAQTSHHDAKERVRDLEQRLAAMEREHQKVLNALHQPPSNAEKQVNCFLGSPDPCSPALPGHSNGS
ncbi:RAS protein activator like-3 [Microcaecilia unicolor]|uniref:RAS protein activator like-3 n=1 Tax=Microcaecilia unicolor TaxID=1415580 RepID=A0A6P7XRG6_9AMPH|nr:RAS protein activator like-3 [Microcaecilia unicolor]